MTSARFIGCAGLALCIALAVDWLVVLERKAQSALDARTSVATSGPVEDTPPRAATWRLIVYGADERRPAALGQEGEIRAGAPGSGWSAVEQGSGIWSLGNRAVIQLPALPEGVADVAIDLDPFLTASLPAQRMSISVGARELGEWRLDQGRTTIHFALPADVPRAGGVMLQLDLPDADSPAHRIPGGADVRRLAIMLHRLTVTG